MNYNFITTNLKKAQDIKSMGFNVIESNELILEVKSPDILTVALYKAKDSKLNNIIVEDTALFVDGSEFSPTDIKHVMHEIEDDVKFNNKKAIWEICFCLKKDNDFYLLKESLTGKLLYPKTETGYHFEKFFAIKINDDFEYFSLLSDEQKEQFNPRVVGLKKLKIAIENNDFSKFIKINNVKDWDGDYQIENNTNKKLKIN